MTILVTGARANIGSRIIARLVEAGQEVRGSARDVRELPLPRGVDSVELDIDNPDNGAAALRNVDAMFLYPTRGTADRFLIAARDAGVRHVVLLSSPASYEPGESDSFIGQLHRNAERSLEESGLRHTVLYPSWLATNARRDWGGQIRARGRAAMAYADAQVSPIHIDDIAEVAVDLLTREVHRGRMQVLTGPQSLRLRDIVGILADVVGQPIPVDDLGRTQSQEQRPPWMSEQILDLLLDGSAAAVGMPATVNNVVERITGHPARPFREWAQANRVDFERDRAG